MTVRHGKASQQFSLFNRLIEGVSEADMLISKVGKWTVKLAFSGQPTFEFPSAPHLDALESTKRRIIKVFLAKKPCRIMM